MPKCFFCDSLAHIIKYMAVPGLVIVPNSYIVCEKHKDKSLSFYDIYNDDGTRKTCVQHE